MNNKEQRAFITGPSIIACVSGVSLQDSEDITDCTQLALWAADQTYNRFASPGDWLNEYARTMRFLGWNPLGEVIRNFRHELTGSVTEHYLQQVASDDPSSRALRSTLIDTFAAIEQDKPAQLSLRQESLNGQHFQIAPVQYAANGQLSLKVSQFNLAAVGQVQEFLFWAWRTESAVLKERVVRFTLDRRTLEAQRPFLVRKISEIRMARFRLRLRAPG